MKWLCVLWAFSVWSHSIVFVHLGKKVPDYFAVAARQARLFNSDCPIYLICNRGACVPGLDGLDVKRVEAESLPKSEFHRTFLAASKLDRRSLDGFWFYTTERFYYLHEFMREYGLRDVFHLENDVMLYCDLGSMLPLFQQFYGGMIGATYEGVERCVPGFFYISGVEPMDRLLAFVAGRVHLNETDMDSVGRFINYERGRSIDTLPVLFPDYAEKRGLRFGVMDDRFWNHFEAFDSLFDAAAMGQYLGGDSPVHNGHSVPGFVNLLSVYDSSHFTFEWEQDERGRNVPFVVFEGVKKRLNNLHVHSKNLAPFYSGGE